MSAISDMLPSDAAEQAEIRRILREQPDLAAMIERAQTKARDMFSDPRFTLDTRQYDDWDPPLRLVIRADVPEQELRAALVEFIHWMSQESGYDRERLAIFPHFRAVLETAR